jgi:hypothetical protein
MPTVAGTLRPARSMATPPLTTLTRPTSSAAATAAVTSRAAATRAPNPERVAFLPGSLYYAE